MEQSIKDYEDDLELSEYKNFSGAIIVIGMIIACGLMIWLSLSGVI